MHARVTARLSAFGCLAAIASVYSYDSAGSGSLRAIRSTDRSAGVSASLPERDPRCPPLFDCTKPQFTCLNSGTCNNFTGLCGCPDGWGGEDCGKPLCGSLADGDKRLARDDNNCTCAQGWTGLTCNVCESNEACIPLVSPDDGNVGGYPGTLGMPWTSLPVNGVDNAPSHTANGALCYKGGFAVKQVHEMCDVTNRKILDMLPDRKPQVTFECKRSDRTCSFQFWVGGKESFYCGLSDCDVKAIADEKTNATEYSCANVACRCIPDRMLCGEAGSVDISDFLVEEIKGPGKFTCRTDGKGCKFDEPAMNNLINDIFGDGNIFLSCQAGECMHYSLVPGFVRPRPPDSNQLIALSIAVSIGIVFVAACLFWYLGRAQSSSYHDRGAIALPADEDDKMMADHTPATLQFANISYSIGKQQILSNVSGTVNPGQMLAIIGASGAGKTSFLDILARKSKRGQVSGESRLNGRAVSDSQFKRVVGFVDQEDTLMSTLTVYETILYSALLRLPRDMSFDAKKVRTLETMHELGIYGIKDSRIGESGSRAISGGEKRRVSIACELVTSPSILFLDEPTSGLDSYNAFNVIESLSQLAKNYNRTVVFTIHQPRSNIVALFDRLLLLASGRVVYSGKMETCYEYFKDIGHTCPSGFNMADFLIDLTMQDELVVRKDAIIGTGSDSDATMYANEQGGTRSLQLPHPRESKPQLSTRSGPYAGKFGSWSSGKSLPFLRSKEPSVSAKMAPQLSRLVEAFANSQIAFDLAEDLIATSTSAQANGQLTSEPIVLSHIARASWWTQFTILSGRAFKNLYRNPMLMLGHYVVSALLALMCSLLFANVTNDIPGFQNRMGLFFFIIVLFGFSCLTSLGVFAKERILFMRERANGYYSPFTYFLAKILFDILPLRVVPPFVLGAIIYKPVGLVPAVAEFWKMILVLILFNLATSSVVFLISVLISDSGLANLVGSMVMLFNLLFAGLLINRSTLPAGTGWIQRISFFHAAFEGLLVNEVRYLQLTEHRYGVDIDVPSATILSFFGFQAQAFWWPDVANLCISFIVFTALSFAALVVVAKERR